MGNDIQKDFCHMFTFQSSTLWEGRSLGQDQNGNVQKNKVLTIFPELQAWVLAIESSPAEEERGLSDPGILWNLTGE